MTYWKRSPNNMKAATLLDYNKKEQLLLRPSYQRGLVWSKSDNQMFILSLLNDFDVNKIFLHLKYVKKKPTFYDVIDGQQRLNALISFEAGEFALPHLSKKGSKDPGLLLVEGVNVEGMFFSQLPESVSRILVGYTFDVTEIDSDDTRRVVQQFVRLQMGHPLSAQEKREAHESALREAVHLLAANAVFARVRFQRGRSNSVIRQSLARLLLFEKNGRISDVLGKKLDAFYLEARLDAITRKEIESLTTTILVVLGDMATVIADVKSPIYTSHLTPLYIFLRRLADQNELEPRQLAELKKWYPNFAEEVVSPNHTFWASNMDRGAHIEECVEILRDHYFAWQGIPHSKNGANHPLKGVKEVI